ncbi:MAG: ribosome maturation factor RimM [Gammaproteobacteria bacterium]|nr:ribosome maturation factor RimM [Gammaproteobacteria bacterium]
MSNQHAPMTAQPKAQEYQLGSAPQQNLPTNSILYGEIVSTWGVRGWINLKLYNHGSHLWHTLTDCWLSLPRVDTSHPPPTLGILAKIDQVQPAHKGLRIKFKGLYHKEMAESWIGWEVYVERSHLPPPLHNEYYWIDLIGLTVYNRQGLLLGRVGSIMNAGAQDLLVVHHEDKKMLIPFIAHYIDQVDILQNCIMVDWQLDY